MIITNKLFRSITLGLHIIAIMAYFLPTLFFGGSMAIGWLIVGVVHTVVFSAMFFRDARTRTALSIIFMILIILWCLILIIIGVLFSLMGLGINPAAILIYSLSSLLAAIFALAGPRRFKVTTILENE